MLGGWHPSSDELTNDVSLLKYDLDNCALEIERLQSEVRHLSEENMNLRAERAALLRKMRESAAMRWATP